MADADQPHDQKPNSAPTHHQALRLRIIPGTFLAIFTTLGLIGVTAELTTIADYNHKYGWMDADACSPSLGRLAISPINTSVWTLSSCGTHAASISSYSWFYGRWRVASIGTIIFVALMLTSKWLESL